MTVGVHSNTTNPNPQFYDKADGLIKYAKIAGLDYRRTAKDEEYDVVINWEPFNEIIRGRSLTICWIWDTHVTDYYARLANESACHIVFRAHATFYHSSGHDPRRKPVYWMPPAVDEEIFRRKPAIRKTHDIVWIGKGQDRNNWGAFWRKLNNHFRVQNYEYGMPYQQYVNNFNRGKMILNVPVMLETNKRVMEAMAIGPALMPWGPDYSLLFTADKDYILLENSKGCMEKINAILSNPDLLDGIYTSGREKILERFTFRKQVERIEKIIRRHL